MILRSLTVHLFAFETAIPLSLSCPPLLRGVDLFVTDIAVIGTINLSIYLSMSTSMVRDIRGFEWTKMKGNIYSRMGASAYQFGITSSRTITEVKQS